MVAFSSIESYRTRSRVPRQEYVLALMDDLVKNLLLLFGKLYFLRRSITLRKGLSLTVKLDSHGDILLLV
jgi:hypothetical protein